MNFSSFRKLDYLVFYILNAALYIVQLVTISFSVIFGILICSTLPALVFGTITNLIFRKRN